MPAGSYEISGKKVPSAGCTIGEIVPNRTAKTKPIGRALDPKDTTMTGSTKALSIQAEDAAGPRAGAQSAGRYQLVQRSAAGGTIVPVQRQAKDVAKW